MSGKTSGLTYELLLDEQALDTAATKLTALSARMENLRKELRGDLKNLKKGFDTPAGEKFFAACGSNLLQPMEDQAAVLKHISDNLTYAKDQYKSVFDEFDQLNQALGNSN